MRRPILNGKIMNTYVLNLLGGTLSMTAIIMSIWQVTSFSQVTVYAELTRSELDSYSTKSYMSRPL